MAVAGEPEAIAPIAAAVPATSLTVARPDRSERPHHRHRHDLSTQPPQEDLK